MDKYNGKTCINCVNGLREVDGHMETEVCQGCKDKNNWKYILTEEQHKACWEHCKDCGWYSLCGVPPGKKFKVPDKIKHISQAKLSAYLGEFPY